MSHAKKVRVAIIGVGNCASSLAQGVHYYLMKSPPVQHPDDLAREMTEAFIGEGSVTGSKGEDVPEKANGYKIGRTIE